MEYYIDKRVFVNGKKSIIHLDNPFNLTEYILSLMWMYPVTIADNGLNIQTVLSSTGIQLNQVELGGTLIKNTSISGGIAQRHFGFFNIGIFGVSARSITLTATDDFSIKTPLVSTASPGWVLTLLNSGTGESEWAPSSGGSTGNIYDTDGVLNSSRVLDGSGYELNFTNLGPFNIYSNDSVFIDSQNSIERNSSTLVDTATRFISLTAPNVVLNADTNLRLVTPEMNAGLPVRNGHVLTLVASTAGDAEWRNPKPGIYTPKYTKVDLPVEHGDFILMDASLGSFYITLPSATTLMTVIFKKVDNSANVASINAASGETIEGTLAGPALFAQYDHVTLVSDGVDNWYKI